MNGELLELFHKLDKRLVSIETIMRERWENHAMRADEIKVELKKLNDWVIDLPCKERIKTTEWLIWSSKLLWATVIIYGLVRGGLFLIK